MCQWSLWHFHPMANENLRNAQVEKNDEFYTQYKDIEAEITAYLEYNPDLFRGKTILLPCDDPEWSNFTKFFAAKFDTLGIKKLISTSYAPESKKMILGGLFSEYEQQCPQFDADKSKIHGKIFILERDITGDGRINIDDLEWKYLEGDGDFASQEVTTLRDEADFIITNPPFSLFRKFFAWLIDSKKQFSIIGSLNSVSYKEIFPKFLENRVWFGPTIHSGDREFQVPSEYPLRASGQRIDAEGRKFIKVKGVRWFTNIDHGRRHKPMELMSMEENLRFSSNKELKQRKSYARYINFDGIDIPITDAIPSDCRDIMGVPLSFLDKYCPEQFEIIGIGNGGNLGVSYGISSNLSESECIALKKEDNSFRKGKLCYRDTNGKLISCFSKLLIRHKL